MLTALSCNSLEYTPPNESDGPNDGHRHRRPMPGRADGADDGGRGGGSAAAACCVRPQRLRRRLGAGGAFVAAERVSPSVTSAVPPAPR